MNELRAYPLCLLLAAVAALATPGCVIHSAPPASSPTAAPGTQAGGIANVAGTAWAGTDSSGSFYEYRFQPSGELHYTSPSGSWTNGTWRQDGANVYMEMNGRYSEYRGTINGTHMTGSASNVTGLTWTWSADLRRP